MKLSEEEKKSLMTNRMNRALETWEETKGIINNKFWYAAANRMYYAWLLHDYSIADKTEL